MLELLELQIELYERAVDGEWSECRALARELEESLGLGTGRDTVEVLREASSGDVRTMVSGMRELFQGDVRGLPVPELFEPGATKSLPLPVPRTDSGTMRTRPFVVPLALFSLAACSSDGGNPTATEEGVLVGDVSLPVAGAVYRGDEAHVFMDGQVTLFCGTHGVFSNAVDPPQQVGQTAVSEYTATFVGELVLEPPAVSSPETHALTVQARMAESITLTETSGGTLTFETELTTFELGGSDMPANVLVRESPDLESAGVTTVASVSGGRSRVETTYDVWLEISLDGGRSWNQAQEAVRMTLQPG